MINIGIIGNNDVAESHIKILAKNPNVNIVGVTTCSGYINNDLSKKYNIKYFTNIDALIEKSDSIDLICNDEVVIKLTEKIFKASKSIFVSSAFLNNTSKAEKLIKLADEANVNVHVSFIERFNPAYVAVKNYIENPLYIESHRLTDLYNDNTSVIYDLMLHDLDLILNTVNSSVRKISATGMSAITKTIDIANARIEFNNGCVANLTASKMSDKNIKKIKFFQHNAHITADLLKNEGNISILNNNEEKYSVDKNIIIKPEQGILNPLETEITSFINAVNEYGKVDSNIEESYNTLKIANTINEKIKVSSNIIY